MKMKMKKLFRRRSLGITSVTKVKSLRNLNDKIVITDAWKHPEKVDNWLKSFGEGDFSTTGFHQSVYPILIIAQFFGVLPVNNISTKSPSQLCFEYRSIRVVYAIFATLVAGFTSFACMAYLIKSTIMFGKIIYLVFNLTSFLSFICFIRLASCWSKIMIEWHRLEKSLPTYDSIEKRYRNRFKMRVVATAILSFSLIEHILSIISVVSVVWDCPKIQNIFQAYMVGSFPMIFFFFPYSIPLSVLVKFGHITATFIWSFTDLFIILISMGLSSLFDRINERMLRVKGKVRTFFKLSFY
jgi:gustatory receptor